MSPMATPTRGVRSGGREKTPKGRFWIEKWESAAIGRKDRNKLLVEGEEFSL